ncbi:phosphatase [Oleiphilus messinensis]|uniref:Phosphatase n=1 Tax=Oleiphilus messinensis TaxID=141451 RepID=A0A1Y0I6W7_9GAMM|nr:macro domain-containing protein [Oleiphilus messinensis]ARU55143.1 phosphatase [Oleiphilus messinensis]
MAEVELTFTDLTTMQVDAIVCPAHKHLTRGRGLSASIFDCAGPELSVACDQQEVCRVGDACITKGFKLPAAWVIHTVTPQWSGGDQWGGSDLGLLRQCYQRVFQVARENGIKSLAVPALGAGTNKAPHLLSARVGLEAVKPVLQDFDAVYFCLHSNQAMEDWSSAYRQLFQANSVQAGASVLH